MNDLEPIIRKIYVIRGQRVMLDRDLAELYGVTTGNLNKAVKRNIRRFPPDFMFQLTKEEWDSLRFQIGIIETGRGKYPKYLPHAFTEQGLAMLSGILTSDIAIDVNISIMRAFVAFRHMSAALPAPSADVVQLRKDFEELKQDIEDILHDQNEINEETRAQLDAINDALTQLQGQKPASDQLPEIGYTAIQKQREKSQNYPPQLTKLNNNNNLSGIAGLTLFHTASRRMSRVFYCLCLMTFTFFIASCQQEEVRTTGMQQLYQESQHLDQASLDSIDHFTAKLGKYIKSTPSAVDDELFEPIVNNINLSLAPHGYCVKVTTLNVGVKVNADWKGEKFINF